MTREEIVAVFERTGVMLKGHFLLTSGRHSDVYMQCARLFEYPEDSALLCGALAKKLKDAGVKADLVVAPAVGGVIMGYEMARALGARSIFSEREEGKMTFRRNFTVHPGEKVVVAEDVITTGGTVAEVVKLVKEAGGEVVGVCSMVDRSNGKADFGVPFYPLLAMEVVNYAPEECPQCKEGAPLVKPGSRKVK